MSIEVVEDSSLPCIETSVEQSNSVLISCTQGFEHIELPVIVMTSEVKQNPSNANNLHYLNNLGHRTAATIIPVPSETTQDVNILDINTIPICEADLLDQDLLSNLLNTKGKIFCYHYLLI